MMLLALLAAGSVMGAGDCHAVTGDAVTAGDLARSIPAFTALAPETRMMPSPRAGVRRILTETEIARMGRRFRLDVSSTGEVCVTVPLHRLDAALVRRALQDAAGKSEAVLEELLTVEAPAGKLEFPRTGLSLAPGDEGKGIWRGAVVYGTARRHPVLCRVRVKQESIQLVAVRDLRPGEALRAEDFREEAKPGAGFGLDPLQAAEVEGLTLRTPVRQGAALVRSALVRKPAVKAGQTVRVDVWQGAAHLILEARVEKNGFPGDWIPVRNPASGKRFSARVLGEGRLGLGEMP